MPNKHNTDRRIQDSAVPNRRLDGVGTDIDDSEGFCPGSHDGQSPIGRVADHEISVGARRLVVEFPAYRGVGTN
ncbi:hypothetical protein RGU77_12950 [Actimicrobium sp. CCI2.3]|nr:hypothetical protein [Actimicrobium sp. CCI2.3]MDY7575180.1 hypothetical protein [Actimicrobium sp. CCI2.3]MEB0022357.1 hypothetical protein [Actimicrobium sp. CCI2.3]